MSKVTVKVVDVQGKESGTLDLDPEIFGAEVRQDLVHATVRWQRAKSRSGTHSTLTPSMMKGGGKKPWKQKHTGRARVGTINSTIWVGGAVVFGPQPRSYEHRLSKRVRKQALCSVLSDKVQHAGLVVVKNIDLASGKTKDARTMLEKIGVAAGKKVVFLTTGVAESAVRASRNLKSVRQLGVDGLNVLDLVDAHYIVSSAEGIKAVEERLKR